MAARKTAHLGHGRLRLAAEGDAGDAEKHGHRGRQHFAGDVRREGGGEEWRCGLGGVCSGDVTSPELRTERGTRVAWTGYGRCGAEDEGFETGGDRARARERQVLQAGATANWRFVEV